MRQLNVILHVELVSLVKARAAVAGVSVTAFVSEALEVAVHGVVGVGSVGGVGVDFAGGGVGSHVAGDSARVSVAGVVGRGVTPDWDALLAAGKAARNVSVVRDNLSQGADPLEDIA